MTKINRWNQLKRIVKFFSLQSLIQLSEGLTGILVIRFLTKLDYSIYTLANSILTSMNMLSELGVSSKVLSLGGKHWENKEEMGRIMAAYNHMRIRMAILASLVVIPAMFYLFWQNGFSIMQFIIALAIALICFWFLFLHRGYRLVLVLNNKVSTYQRALLLNALIRLGGTLLLGWIFFPFWVAFGLALVMNLGNYLILRKKSLPFFAVRVENREHYYTEFQSFVTKQIPYYGYLVIQGQITILIITFAGETSMIADFGAISRITLVIAVVQAYFTTVVYPKMAKIQEKETFIRQYWFYILLLVILGISLVVSMYFLQDVYIWLIGPQYENVKHLLPLMTLIVAVKLLMGTIYGINHAKGWIEHTWIIVPTTLVTQLAMIGLLNLQTLFGVLIFNLVTDLPNLVSNFAFSYFGIKRLPPSIE